MAFFEVLASSSDKEELVMRGKCVSPVGEKYDVVFPLPGIVLQKTDVLKSDRGRT